MSWHVPTPTEIDFAIQLFKELVEPTLASLLQLLHPGKYVILVISSILIPPLNQEQQGILCGPMSFVGWCRIAYTRPTAYVF